MSIVNKMNVYDFDKTIYASDSTADFIKYCFWHHPKTLINIPRIIGSAIGWKVLHVINKTRFKQNMYHMFSYLEDIDADLEKFTQLNKHKIKRFYLDNQQPDDLIISASPAFIVEGFLKAINTKGLIASTVDKKTGKYTGINCHGEEKVVRFYQQYPDGKIKQFYSDSYSDTPLAKLAQEAYLVKGDKLLPWDFSKHK